MSAPGNYGELELNVQLTLAGPYITLCWYLRGNPMAQGLTPDIRNCSAGYVIVFDQAARQLIEWLPDKAPVPIKRKPLPVIASYCRELSHELPALCG
ncbi:MAG TPA: hypothetical protein VFY62_00075 [Pseudomonas sp.]|nr:hypothetical protein [Pseudomonas sp.]